MFTERLRRVSYGWLILQGLAAALAPKRSIEMNVKLWGFPFENTDALEPKAWYVRAARATGIGMITAGIAGLVLEPATDSEDEAEDDEGRSPAKI